MDSEDVAVVGGDEVVLHWISSINYYLWLYLVFVVVVVVVFMVGYSVCN